MASAADADADPDEEGASSAGDNAPRAPGLQPGLVRVCSPGLAGCAG